MTAADLLLLPDDGHRYDLSLGELIVTRPALLWSSMVALAFVERIRPFVREQRSGIVAGPDGGMLLHRDPDTLRAPDVSFIRRERIPPDLSHSGFVSVAPDLAVEVFSPSDRMVEVNRKIRDYFAAGTSLIWVVDPESRSALVYHPDRPVEIVAPDGVLDGETVLPGFALSLADLWAELDDDL